MYILFFSGETLKMKNLYLFTIIELLTVINIIVILISILLPSLQKAKGATNRISRTRKMRPITQAILPYASDFTGLTPYNVLFCYNYLYNNAWPPISVCPEGGQGGTNIIYAAGHAESLKYLEVPYRFNSSSDDPTDFYMTH